MTFLGGKIPIFPAQISDDLFLVIDQIFQIFPFFSQIFPMFAMLNVIFDPFLTGKTRFFTLVHTFTRIRQHYFSKYWGTNAWAVPPPQILGETVPLGSPSLQLMVSVNSCI